jgi:hypothetical protein
MKDDVLLFHGDLRQVELPPLIDQPNFGQIETEVYSLPSNIEVDTDPNIGAGGVDIRI